jgi:alpha-mannosidase
MALSESYLRKIRYYIKNLPERIYKPIESVGFDCFFTFERFTYEEAKQQKKVPAKEGTAWGVKWEYGWFFAKIVIPEECAGRRVVFKAQQGECIVYVNGQIFGALDKQHKEITLSECAVCGAKYDIAIEAYAGHDGLADTLDQPHAMAIIPDQDYEFHDDVKQKVIRNGNFGIYNDIVFGCVVDISILFDLRNNLDDNSLRKAQIDRGLKKACDIIDIELPEEEFVETVKEATDVLKPLLKCKNGSTAPTAYAIGHSHLDLEWLWTKNETVRKIARTIGNQLKISYEYADYKYLQSQPWLLEVLKNNYPGLYGEFRERVKEGKFIVEGGMWVEADTNIPSGESLIRQFLFGKRFIEKEFGTESRMLWLPDVFGCSAALPQIMKGCGIEYFMNAKIKWLYDGGDLFPHSNFMWKGIDGTRIHSFITQEYATEMTPSKVFEKWSLNCEKEDVPAVMIPFGHGDGGGGATRIHAEYMNRENNLEGMPKVICESPIKFFEYVSDKCKISKEYVGELYYAAHRGSYTTQAETKKLNRKCEFSLRDAEIWSTLMGFGKEEKSEIDNLWKTVLFNQFHDIIPGTSIKEVYETANREYNEVINACGNIVNNSIRNKVSESEEYITVFNSLSWERNVVIEIPSGYDTIYDEVGEKKETQNTGNKVLAQITVPSFGYKAFRITKEKGIEIQDNSSQDYSLENNVIKAIFNCDGDLVSIYDKVHGYEALSGNSNVFRVYKDMPLLFDAWDIDEFYENQEIDIEKNCEIYYEYIGNIETALVIKRKINKSTVLQKIKIKKDEYKIDFETEVDWKETHKLLKVDFSATVESNELISETQFGHLKRPTHKNRRYDCDRFEVCQHKWSALVNGNRGFAILNDSKYGISAKSNKVSLTLLKASTHPDLYADKKKHNFVYSVMVFTDSLCMSEVCHKAYEINCPVLVRNVYLPEKSYVNIDNKNIVLETLKISEDGNGDIIARFYECGGTRGKAIITLAIRAKKLYITNMLEKNIAEVDVKDSSLEMDFGPFEIKTIRIVKEEME